MAFMKTIDVFGRYALAYRLEPISEDGLAALFTRAWQYKLEKIPLVVGFYSHCRPRTSRENAVDIKLNQVLQKR